MESEKFRLVGTIVPHVSTWAVYQNFDATRHMRNAQ